MNPHAESKFYLGCLDRTTHATDNIILVYNAGNESFAQNVLSCVSTVIDDLEAFYSSNIKPDISIFIYPDVSSMSKAFGRQLKSDQWCFAPIKGENSLITFTAKIDIKVIPQVLIHELSHVYFSRITGNVDLGNYRQSIPLWLDEGIALYLDSKYRHGFDQTLRNRLQVLKSKEDPYFPKLMDLYTYFNRLDENEFGIKSQKAYCFSYFCVRELIETFGADHIVDFIKKPDLADNFDQVFDTHFRCPLPTYNARMPNKYSGSSVDIYKQACQVGNRTL